LSWQGWDEFEQVPGHGSTTTTTSTVFTCSYNAAVPYWPPVAATGRRASLPGLNVMLLLSVCVCVRQCGDRTGNWTPQRVTAPPPAPSRRKPTPPYSASHRSSMPPPPVSVQVSSGRWWCCRVKLHHGGGVRQRNQYRRNKKQRRHRYRADVCIRRPDVQATGCAYR
jgi:hypothetical protein